MIIGGIGVYSVTAGAVTFLRWSLTFIERSIDESTDPAVTPEKRAELKRELQRLRNNLRDKDDAVEAQPILLEMNRAISDRRLTAEEVDDLIGRLQKANDRLEGKSGRRSARRHDSERRNGTTETHHVARRSPFAVRCPPTAVRCPLSADRRPPTADRFA